jgi:hypothetical protein
LLNRGNVAQVKDMNNYILSLELVYLKRKHIIWTANDSAHDILIPKFYAFKCQFNKKRQCKQKKNDFLNVLSK